MGDVTWQEKWDKFQDKTIKKMPQKNIEQIQDAEDACTKLRNDFCDMNKSVNGGDYGMNRHPLSDVFLEVIGASNIAKHMLIQGMNDTPFSCDIDVYCDVLNDLGFEKVLTDLIGKEEVQIWARPDGLLMVVDTYEGMRNSSDMYFVYQPDDENYPSGCSGSFQEIDGKRYWIGNRDMREGLRVSLRDMENKGRFISNWPAEIGKSQSRFNSFSLVCEQDYSHVKRELSIPVGDRTEDQKMYDAVDLADASRKKRLPLWVKQMVGMEPVNTPLPAQKPLSTKMKNKP